MHDNSVYKTECTIDEPCPEGSWSACDVALQLNALNAADEFRLLGAQQVQYGWTSSQWFGR